VALKTHGLLPVPASRPAQLAELQRLERELEHTPAGRRRRVLAIERRRVLVELHG
jgi:hypothetical protein